MLYPVGWLSTLGDQAINARVTGNPPPPHQPQPWTRLIPPPSVSATPMQPMLPEVWPQLRFSQPSFSPVAPPLPPPPLLQPGSRGQAVHMVQIWLHQEHIYRGVLDGIYGPLTTTAVRQFQQQAQLSVDGLVGPVTWRQLQRPLVSTPQAPIPHPAGRTLMAAVSHPTSTPALPAFTPPQLQLSFHPIALTPAADPTRSYVWVTVLTLIALGGGTVTLQQTPARTTGGHRPPAIVSRSAQTIHRPQPIYPPPLESPNPPGPDQPQTIPSMPRCPEAVKVSMPVPVTPGLTTVRAAPTAALPPPHPPLNWAWPDAETPACLEDFLFDLTDATCLDQLIAQMGPARLAQTAELPHLGNRPLTQRLGVFPAHHQRTGYPFLYTLIDDMGGCFRIQKNELWLTEAARGWLQDDVPYRLTIRRRDPQGQTTDKTFVVRLNHYQLQLG